MTDYLLRVSWPVKALQPHAKGHWRPKAAATSVYRREAAQVALTQGVASSPDAELHFLFYPPDNRLRDLHNMPAQMKPVIDGIADFMGVDDRGFKCFWPQEFSSKTKGGAVLVEVKPKTVILPVVGSTS